MQELNGGSVGQKRGREEDEKPNSSMVRLESRLSTPPCAKLH